MSSPTTRKIFLFSIDLEDVRLGVENGEQYKERVPQNTNAYLNWLAMHNFKCTFFTVGNMAAKYPSLIKEIADEGHEIACHTLSHITLDRHTPETFRADLEQNMELLFRAGAKNIAGFRAPTFSLSEKTQWAFPVLEDLGILYSSSVLPANNPLFGWKNFGVKPKTVEKSLVEIPMSTGKFGPLNIPFGGGIYFRVLPEFWILSKCKQHAKSDFPVLGYFHPYDIDLEQEHFMHPGLKSNHFYNFLMYFNRKNVFSRLEKLIAEGFNIVRYDDFVKNKLH
jgi:polysaccharide deacetylase family protein (PEP-CTERM system associated)